MPADYGRLAPNVIAMIIPRRGRPKQARNIRDLLLPGCTYTDSGSERSSGLSLNLNNTNGRLLYDKDIASKGTVISFSYGYPGRPSRMYDAGQFVIKNHRGNGNVLTIECKPRKRGRMARKKYSRRWDATKRSIVVREVLAQHFPAAAIHIDETTVEIDTITQTAEHDWQFVQRQAQLAQREFYVDARGVHWKRPRRNQAPSRLLRYVRNPVGVGEILAPPTFEGLGSGIPGRV
ncbi:MAG: hypothetical protein GTN69_01905, partial [Armatimonadetes bacterium]|nr:hypothetical protein [Armatimonadota bacterium]